MDGDTALTYEQLLIALRRIGMRLRRQGIGRGDVVAVWLERAPRSIASLLGVLDSGAAYAPIDPRQPALRLRAMLQDLRPRAQVASDEIPPMLGGLAPLVRPGDGDRDADADVSAGPDVCERDLAYVLHTSGSTGKPKRVMVEHGQLDAYLATVMGRLGLAGPASYLMVQSLAVDMPVTVLFGALLHGGTLHVLDREQAIDPAFVAGYLARTPIDVVKITPSHLRALQRVSDPASLMPRRCLILGGEACSWEWAVELAALAPHCQVVNEYGPTETTVGVTVHRVPSTSDTDEHDTTPIGRPLPGVRAYIVDREMQLNVPGAVGELLIGGDQVGRGYLARPDLTGERFVPDPFSRRSGARLYRTGDEVRLAPDGVIHFLGRRDGQVKIRGFRVELREIELAFESHPGVRRAAVVAEPEAGGHRRLAAYVVVSSEAVTDEQLRRWLADRLPDYMVPATIDRLDDLPLGPGGKLDRSAIGVVRDAGAPAAGMSAAETALAALWQELLPAGPIDASSNFFALGGHSLLLLQLIDRVRATFHTELSLRAALDHPVLRDMAAVIEGLVGLPT